MPVYTKQGGVWKESQELYTKQGGVWKSVEFGYSKQGGVWKEFYARDVTVTLSNSTNVTASALFSGSDWASNKHKRVIIPSGVTIGSNTTSTAAFLTGTGWGGELTIENNGTISGAGGGASGVGGDAFDVEAPGATLLNAGVIRSGGGGGGTGGSGGGGSYVQTNVEGPYFTPNVYLWRYQSPKFGGGGYPTTTLVWAGSVVSGPEYVQGALYNTWESDNWEYWDYYISKVTYTTIYTSGGAGGAGGIGEGYTQTNTSGAAGAAGGTNAGAGGAGGIGGVFGSTGATGATGANGNVGSGLAGSAGALAGYALTNIGNISLTNTGTIIGR